MIATSSVWISTTVGVVGAIGPTDIVNVDEFIDAPRAVFGRTGVEIERQLGTPLGREVRPPRTGRDSGVATHQQELSYPGLLIRLSGSSALHRVAITASGFPLPRGLNVGTSRSDVERVLGEPQETTATRYLYLYSDGYPDTVEFYFRDDRVHRIEWMYWSGE